LEGLEKDVLLSLFSKISISCNKQTKREQGVSPLLASGNARHPDHARRALSRRNPARHAGSTGRKRAVLETFLKTKHIETHFNVC
jgi:hypothetical protein